MNKPNAPVRYLPTREFHIIPITDITPDAVKISAKKTLMDREKISLTTRQSIIVKRLGFEGGFAGYKKAFETSLLPFMEQEGMHTRANLVRPRFRLPIISLSAKEIADKIFSSNSSMPCKIFTGYDVNWDKFNQEYFSYLNPWIKHTNWKFNFQDVCDALSGKGPLGHMTPEVILTSALEAKRHLIGGHWNNLLGNHLLIFDKRSNESEIAIPTIYFDSTCDKVRKERSTEECLDALRVFSSWSHSQQHGWVEVIPFNNHLIFLKGQNGEYDFLFRGLQDYPFNHNIYGSHLKNSDVCKSIDTYHFNRWFYFEYSGWEKQDRHNAENQHYLQNGTPANYPGETECLRRYFLENGQYSRPKKNTSNESGFFPIETDEGKLGVSNLITVDEFRAFMHDNQHYAEYSRTDPGNEHVDLWEPNNSPIDGSLPASVTWYDAIAYATWISKTRRLPVRLLTEDEYFFIASPRKPLEIDEHTIFNFYDVPRIARYYENEDELIDISFHSINRPNVVLRYIPETLNWITADSGLRFLISSYFGEWLALEGAAVDTKTLSALCAPGASPYRGRFSPGSTGSYKSMKVGFRLCYLIE